MLCLSCCMSLVDYHVCYMLDGDECVALCASCSVTCILTHVCYAGSRCDHALCDVCRTFGTRLRCVCISVSVSWLPCCALLYAISM